MKKRLLVAGAVMAGVGGAWAVAVAQDDLHREVTPTVAPSPQAQEVLSKVSGYKSWSKFAENQTPKFSKGHDRMHVLAFHNDFVAQAIRNKTVPLPDGSLIVKENRPQPNAAPTALTIMSKQNGAWYWIKSTPDAKRVFTDKGEPLAGDLPMCTGCHAQAKTDDVFTHDFSK